MRSTATACSCSWGLNPPSLCSAGVGCLAMEMAIGGFAVGRCRWRRSSSASCPVIRFDPGKGLRILQERSLDFLDAEIIFAGPTLEFPDRRRDYGELRFICFGFLRGRSFR